MNPIRIEPQKALDEAVRFNQKLSAGLTTLRNMDEVDYGASAKDEVYREDKLVLYRFRGDTQRVAFTESTFKLATDTNSPSVSRSMASTSRTRPSERSRSGVARAPRTVDGTS